MVDNQRMWAHLEEFSKWQKYSGSEDERKSFDYLQAQLDSYGFKTRRIEHDAYISIPGAARVQVQGRDLTCITHSFSRPGGKNGVSGALVYGGRGLPEDLEGLDCKGKIVLFEGIANPGAASVASAAGAAGQIHISPHDLLHEMCISPVWGNPEPDDLAKLPTTVVCSVSNTDGAWLKSLADTAEATLFAEVDTCWRKTPILTGDLIPEGAADDVPFVLFSGHHDTWYYGVMDNGAANATMLETARMCAERRGQWTRGIRVAFWSGHSHGRYSGSTWYTDTHWAELDARCVAHVNVDSTGGMNSTVLENAEAMSVLRGLAEKVIHDETGVTIKGNRMARAGDQSLGGVGIPAMFMGFSQQAPGEDKWTINGTELSINRQLPVGLGWWWHTPEDTIDKIDPEHQARDTRVYVRTLTALLEDAYLPLDFAPLVAELEGIVQELAPKVSDKVDLDPLFAAASALRAALESKGQTADDQLLMRLSRALVPMDYTSGDRFGQDPALRQAAFPVLDPLRNLAASDEADAPFITVAACRARNRVIHALGTATAALLNR